MNHDPMCRHRPVSVVSGEPAVPCDCDLIELVIVREQARIMAAIEAIDPVEWALAGQDAGRLFIQLVLEAGDADH